MKDPEPTTLTDPKTKMPTPASDPRKEGKLKESPGTEGRARLRLRDITVRCWTVLVLILLTFVGGGLLGYSGYYRDLLFPEYFAILCLLGSELIWLLSESKIIGSAENRSQSAEETSKLARFLTLVIIFGFYLLARAAWAEAGDRHRILFVILLWSATFLVLGGLIGFLFGIPRTLSGNESENNTKKSTPGRRSPSRVNTNLERVSDWLTQIIVGGTVTQLALLPRYAEDLGDYFAAAMGPAALGGGPWPLIGVGSSLYFFITGFLATYLITRLYLSSAILRADDPSVAQVEQLLTEAELLPLEAAPIRYGEGNLNKFDVEATEAAQKVLQLDLDQLCNWRDLRVWAKAQLAVNQPAKAIQGYTRAFQIVPNDAESRLGYAIALSLTNSETSQVLTQLEAACNSVMPSTSPGLRKNIYVSLFYRLLYLKKPESFKQVMQRAKEYFSSPKAVLSASIHFNIACAYAQAYTWLKADPQRRLKLSDLSYRPLHDDVDDTWRSNADALNAARAGALGILKLAFERRPELRTRLREMLTPPAAGKPWIEDDFESFVGDPDFRKLAEAPVRPGGDAVTESHIAAPGARAS